MKTRIISIVSIAVLPFALFSCNKVAQSTENFDAPLVTIEASIPDQATKVVAVTPESGVGLDWNWEEEDNISVISGDVSSLFKIRSGFEGKLASFIGKQVSGSNFSIIYPGECASVADIEAVSIANQMQTGIDSKEHLEYFALLSDVDNYRSFEFSQAWASDHGGSFKQSGVLRFALTLPSEAVVVNRITLKAGDNIFHSGNAADARTSELSIAFTEATLDSEKTVTGWMTTSWWDDVIPAETPLSVFVSAGEYSWTADITPSSEKVIKAGYVNNVTIGADAWKTAGRYADGDGTLENPWQIKTPTQLTYMRDDLVPGETRYFKLITDIDMAGVEWAPLNNVDPYDKFINFDGNGYTISNLTIKEGAAYASFVGVLYGDIRNVTFSRADITAGEGNKSGIVAGYVGTTAALTPCMMSNVVVTNSTITGARSMGAVVGQVATDDAAFVNCRVIDTKVIQTASSTSHAGGFVGYSQANAYYQDCFSTATIEGTEFTGGFAGYIGKGQFFNCHASGDVNGTKHVGGFVGKTEDPVFNKCWYDGDGITATDATKNCQSGGFVGYAAKNGNFGAQFFDCYVKGATIDAASGQRIGGFVGQSDLGNTYIKCYVKDVVINASTNSAGFAGVDYSTTSADVPEGGIYRCFVDGGVINANGNNIGGFVAYPEGAIIENCFTTMDVNGGANSVVGGFAGICNKKVSIKWCYSAGEITGTGTPIGAFAGKLAGDASTIINSCIAWNNTLEFVGASSGSEDVTGNYLGTEGTIAAKAAELGWDPEIWDFSAKLK